ncbi:MAG: ABC transporter permease [Paludibacter sp.]|nr:ABC transporter permease [Paludibacter sp.]
MSKISLIIKREYTTRVMKKSFIILTFLTPILFAGMIMVPLWLSSIKDSAKKNIVVIDHTNKYREVLKNSEDYTFDFVDKPAEEIRKNNAKSEGFAALLVITDDLAKDPKAVSLYSDEQVNMELKNYVAKLLNNYVEQEKLAAYQIPNLKEMVEKSRADINITTIKWGENGQEKVGSAELALVIGMISAFMIYMFIVIYGAQVMSGVVQEKTSRIVEVIISSVKPFELMMGKIIGIAMVGLTQFFLWMVFTVIISTVVGSFIGGSVDVNALQQANSMGMGAGSVSSTDTQNIVREVYGLLSGFDFAQIVVLFVIYFLGGYLLYASLFAAVGSAVDSETDTQQFSLPLTLPIIFAIYAAIYSAQNPDGPLAFWCSMVPFTSPIVMMVRLPFGVPAWQIILSLSILILSFIGSTWMAGKIYRTGILMYGKKVTWKEMWKWLRY